MGANGLTLTFKNPIKEKNFHFSFSIQILVRILQWKIYIVNRAEELSVIYTLFKSASRVVVICIRDTHQLHRNLSILAD